jgi:hypothetical protein
LLQVQVELVLVLAGAPALPATAEEETLQMRFLLRHHQGLEIPQLLPSSQTSSWRALMTYLQIHRNGIGLHVARCKKAFGYTNSKCGQNEKTSI